MDENRQQFGDNIRKLLKLKEGKSDQLLKETLEMFSLSIRRKVILTILFITLFFIIKFILFDDKFAAEIITTLTTNLNSIIVPFFAIIITGYAIFQAIANEETILVLLRVSHKGKESKFAVYNKYFYGIANLFLILIILNVIIQFVFGNMSKDWSLEIFDNCFNEVLAAFLIDLYLIIVMNALIEMKSFIYNLMQVFITSTASTGIKALEKMNEEDNE